MAKKHVRIKKGFPHDACALSCENSGESAETQDDKKSQYISKISRPLEKFYVLKIVLVTP